MIQLRPDQAQVKQAINNAWLAGARNVLAVMPTGGGKSVVVSDIVLDHERYGWTQAVLAHRTELVGQMSLHIARRGVQHRIIGPAGVISSVIAEHRRELNGHCFVNPSARCAVAAVDTLNARADTLGAWAAQVDSWVIDEAHHVLADNKWGKTVAMFARARGLGVTATPERADGKGLGADNDGVFYCMVQGLSMRELIDIGALSDYEIVVPESDFRIDDANIAPSGDWSTKKLRAAAQASHIVGDVVAEYSRRAWGKRGITFATDVETANEIAQRFNDAGVPSASVSAKTPDHVRADYIRRFRDGRLWQLVNVDLFGEGFDVPAVEVVSMARPTASLAVFLQQFGRALRILPGKSHGLVIDHVSNWKRHGLPDRPRFWSLDRRDKRAKRKPDPEEIALTACRECSKPYERAFSCCPYCGYAPELTPTERRSIEQVDGDLILLDRDKLAELRAAIELPTPADVGSRAGFVAGELAGKGAANRARERIEAQGRLRAAIEQWAGWQRWRGRDDQQSYRRFYLALGVDVLSALVQDRQKMEELAQLVEGWNDAQFLDNGSINHD